MSMFGLQGKLVQRVGSRVPTLGGAAAGFSGAYDAVETDIAHAYEPARRVLTSYTGDLIRLRRDSDDAESDFGYDSNGDLDTAAISTWLGGASGYFVTVYDQKGSDDVTQATKSAQPLYVASIQNSKPGMRLDGSNGFLKCAFTTGGALSQPLSILAAAALDASATNDDLNHFLFDGDDVGNRVILIQRPATDPDTWQIWADSFVVGGASDSDWNIWSAIYNGVSSEFFKNGSSEGAGDAGSLGINGIVIGNNYSPVQDQEWDGDIIVPAIVFDSALSSGDRSAMETAINDYYAIY